MTIPQDEVMSGDTLAVAPTLSFRFSRGKEGSTVFFVEI